MNVRTNTLRVAGPADVIDALLAKVGGELTAEALVPPPEGLPDSEREAWERKNWGVPGIASSETPWTDHSNGLRVVEWDFSTTRGLPFALAASMVENDPSLVASLSSVDLPNGHAEIRVYGNGDEWSYEAEASEIEDFEDDDATALTSLASTAQSVVDDYEVAVARKAGPAA